MAAISIIKTPYIASWSRNPILFSFKVTPFTTDDINNRSRLQLSLQVETHFNSNIYASVWAAVEYPDALGFATIDLSAVLDTQLEFYVPNKQYVKFHRCKQQVKRYQFTYSLIDNDGQQVVPASSGIYYVVKGGLSKEQWHPSEFFATNILVQQKMLHHTKYPTVIATMPTIRTDEPKWLFFMMPATNSTYLKLVVIMVFAGGGASTVDLLLQNMSVRTFEILCVPVDYITLSIAALTPPGDLCTSYSVSVWDDTVEHLGGGPLYGVDYRPMYEPVYLLYRNSLGGLETQSFLGEKDFEIDIEKSKAEIVQLTKYLSSFNMQFESFTTKSFRAQKTKGNTGWITQDNTDKLIDMFLDKQVYTPYGNKLLPVQIDTKSATLYKDVTKLYNLTLVWSLGWLDENFSLKNTVAQGNTCPAVFYFVASQVYGGKLHLVWKLDGDFDKIEIEYIIDGTPNTITLNGNSGEVDIFIDSPATGVSHIVKVKARTVCNDEAAPFSYGAYTVMSTLNILPRMVPIAVNDVSDETFRGTGVRKLQRLGVSMEVLLNDIPLNGGWGTFENFYNNVPAITVVSNNGATVIYNIDDTIDYTPSGASLAITAEDYVQYRFIENIPAFGPYISNYAKIRIPMKGQIPKVYFHFKIINETDGIENYGFLNQYGIGVWVCDVYVQFFKDYARTIPIDVSTFGLVIGYKESEETTHYSYFANPGAPSLVTGPLVTFAALGFSMAVKIAWQRHEFIDLGLGGADSIHRALHIQPGTGAGNWEYVQ